MSHYPHLATVPRLLLVIEKKKHFFPDKLVDIKYLTNICFDFVALHNASNSVHQNGGHFTLQFLIVDAI